MANIQTSASEQVANKFFDVIQLGIYIPVIAIMLDNSYLAFARHDQFFGFVWGALAFGILVRFTRLIWDIRN